MNEHTVQDLAKAVGTLQGATITSLEMCGNRLRLRTTKGIVDIFAEKNLLDEPEIRLEKFT